MKIQCICKIKEKKITYCRLHAAAPKLMQVLEGLLNKCHFSYRDEEPAVKLLASIKGKTL